MWTENKLNFVSQKRTSISGDTGDFIKFVMMGSALSQPDILYLLDLVEFYGKDLDPGLLKRETRSYMISQDRFDPWGNQPRSQRAALK